MAPASWAHRPRASTMRAAFADPEHIGAGIIRRHQGREVATERVPQHPGNGPDGQPPRKNRGLSEGSAWRALAHDRLGDSFTTRDRVELQSADRLQDVHQ